MNFAIIFSALMLGFLGSWHCGVMCGPLSCNFKKQNDFMGYHLGRLFSYLLMGSFLFWGCRFFINVESRPLKLASSFLFFIIFILFGLRQLNVIKFKTDFITLIALQFKILKSSQNITQKFPFVLGLLTGLFPCMWLYSFLFLAAQTQNILLALVLVGVFWLSSLPAFFVFNRFLQVLIQKSPVSYQKIAGLVLIMAGVLSVLGHWSHLLVF